MKLKSFIALERWPTVTAVMFVASMATLLRSYVAIKLLFLLLFLIASLLSITLRRPQVVVYRRLVLFYLWLGLAAAVWAVIGLLHPDNFAEGATDALRLYVVWSAAFVVLYTLLRVGPSLRLIHAAMVIAGILIPIINFVGLYGEINHAGLISEDMRQELSMKFGIGDNLIVISSHNIGAMFLIAPYLLSMQFRTDEGDSKANSILTKLALVLSLILVAISGRRALWLLVAFTPFAVLLLSRLTGGYGLMKAGRRRFLLAYAAAGVIGLSMLFILPDDALDIPSVEHLKYAFSSKDERTILAPYLINGFMESPILGVGFGGYAGYLRNSQRPWTYELTYHTLLFNTGLVGATFLLALFSIYLWFVLKLLRRFKDGSAIPFGLIIALGCLLVGAYSDPYLGSFDTLFFVGLLPYLSTFQQGFDQPRLAAGVAT
ncbi:MAG: hypothetical protein M3P27_11470 [Acidobacteriota bacterium]|nr:hypothetical protein [Acidobacteriota bacterium]